MCLRQLSKYENQSQSSARTCVGQLFQHPRTADELVVGRRASICNPHAEKGRLTGIQSNFPEDSSMVFPASMPRCFSRVTAALSYRPSGRRRYWWMDSGTGDELARASGFPVFNHTHGRSIEWTVSRRSRDISSPMKHLGHTVMAFESMGDPIAIMASSEWSKCHR